MAVWDKLRTFLFGSSGAAPTSSLLSSDPDALWFYFRCGKCGTAVRIRVNRRNDANRIDEGPGAFLVRKEVMDSKCFQIMKADIYLDPSYRLVTAHVEGGELITAEEYQTSLDAQR